MALILTLAMASTISADPISEATRKFEAIEDNYSILLNDNTFEHDTQAATGATTGDWFVFFHDKGCDMCNQYKRHWAPLAKMVAEDDELYLNMARVDMSESPETIQRFSLYKFPTLLYFHRGSYREVSEKGEAEMMYRMLREEGWRKYESKEVPKEKSGWWPFW